MPASTSSRKTPHPIRADMSDPDPQPAARPGFTLDLSTGKPGRPRATRKGPPPVVQQTINLSTKTAAKAPEAPPEPAPTPAAKQPRGAGPRSGGPARSGGTSLADLLDADTLARLRGER
jgi:hypothetical protein